MLTAAAAAAAAAAAGAKSAFVSELQKEFGGVLSAVDSVKGAGSGAVAGAKGSVDGALSQVIAPLSSTAGPGGGGAEWCDRCGCFSCAQRAHYGVTPHSVGAPPAQPA